MARTGVWGARRRAAVVVAAALVSAPGTLATPALGAPVGTPPARVEPASGKGASARATEAKAREAVEKMPLRFEPNRGQADPAVRFLARGPGYTLFLTTTEAVMTLSPPPADPDDPTAKATIPPSARVVRMALPRTSATPKLEGTRRLAGVTHYLIGNNRSAWQRNIPAYAGVRYKGVQPGIDLVFYGGAKGLEYDFVVAPGADPSLASLTFAGAEPTVEPGGDLVLRAGAAEVRQAKPVLYQTVDGKRRPITGAFALRGDGRVGFSVGAYDPARPLVIDPVITYSSYLGGSTGGSSVGLGVVADPTTVGHAYVTGVTFATNFPVAGTPFDATANGNSDRFVSKLNTNGSGLASLVWSTYIGGSRFDDADGAMATLTPATSARGLAVDGTGAVYIAGETTSTNFPTAGTVTAHDATCGTNGTCNASNPTYADGASTNLSTTYTSASAEFNNPGDVGRGITGTNIPAGTTIAAVTNPTTITLSQPATGAGTNLSFTIQARSPVPDGFVAKLSSTGSTLLYASYLGGSRREVARGVALSGTTAYVVGETHSADLPTTATPFDATCGSDGVCDATDVQNADGVSTSGSTTYTSATASFGPSSVGKTITGTNIPGGTTIAAVTNHYTATLSQAATASGTGLSYTIVDATPVRDGFLATFNTSTGAMAYSTFLGGAGTDAALGVAVDGSGRAHAVGSTSSSNLPMAGTPFDSTLNGGDDGFVARLDPAVPGTAALSYSTYLGGTADDDAAAVAIDGAGMTHVTGSAASTDFPTANAYDGTANGGNDAIIAKFDTGAAGAASLLYSTYLGGSMDDAGSAIAVMGSPAAATVAGTSGSSASTFPTLRPLFTTGSSFVTSLASTGASLVYSTRFPAPINGVALDTSGNPYLTGSTGSGLPVTTATAYQSTKQSTGTAVDAFLTRLDPVNDAPLVTSSAPRGGPPNGGTSVTITGSLTGTTAVNFGTAAVTTSPCPANPTSAGCFTQNSGSQITAVSPACAGFPLACTTTTVNITVTNAQGTSPTTPGATFTYGEGIFSATSNFGGNRGVALQNGQIFQPFPNPTPSKLYDPVTATTTDTGTCPATCGELIGETVLLNDGRVLMMGGLAPCSQCNRVAITAAHLYDPATGVWSPTGSMANARHLTRATLLTVNCGTNCGKVMVVGGCAEDCGNLGEADVTNTGELYNPASGTWSAVTNTTGTALFREHTATLLDGPNCWDGTPDSYCGKVLVAGGFVSDLEWNAIDEARLYDPIGNDFEAAGTGNGSHLVAARGAHTATLLMGPDCTDGSPAAWCGKVLFAGGHLQGGAGIVQPTSELYDPAAAANSRFASTGPMLTARGRHAAAPLPSGKVLVAGGGFTAAEAYQPGTGTWASAGATQDGIASSPIVLGRAGGPSSACQPHCGKVLFPSSSGGYHYTPLAVVTALDRTTDCTTGGAAISVTGTGLSAVTTAAFGSGTATRLLPDVANPDTRLVVVTPGGTVGPANLTLTSPGGISAAATFTYTTPGVAPCAPQSPVGNARNGGTTVAWSAASGSPTSYTVTPEDPKPLFTDGFTISGSTTFFSSTASFTPSDVGTVITGPAGLPGGRTIASVQSPSQVTLSSAATAAGTGQAFSLAARGDTSFSLGSTTNGSATFTVAQPNGVDEVHFTSADVGRRITGTNIPANTTISAVVNAATVTLSQNATGTGSNLPFTVRNRGYLAASAVPLTCPCTLNTTISPLTNTLTNGTRLPYLFRVTATNAGGTGPAAVTGAVFPQVTAGTFTPLTPARILDTRSAAESGGATPVGTCLPTPCAKLGAAGNPNTIEVAVAGQGGVPASGASAVVLNLTVTGPAGGAAFLTVYPCDAALPNASNLNYLTGQTVPNLVTVKLSTSTANGCSGPGRIRIANNAGEVHAIADVAGWLDDGTGVAGSRLNSVTPARVLDTRSAAESGNPANPTGTCTPGPCAAVAAGTPVEFQVAGRGGVPATGATAVVLNVTVTGPTADSFLTAWPSDAAQPTASNLNYAAGQTVPNLVTVKLSPTGTVKVANHAGSTHVIADVAGWYAAAGSLTGARFSALTPARVLDTRSAAESGNPANPIGTCTPSPCAPIGAGATLTLTVAGTGGVPGSGASAVVMNTTVTGPTASSFMTVWPSDASQPNASNLNYTAGQTVPNLVAVRLGADGRIKLFNAAGTTHAIADVAGWFNDGNS